MLEEYLKSSGEKSPWKDFYEFFISRKFLWCLVLVGIALRLFEYLANKSLWYDEAWLAENFIELSYTQLTGPLLNGQAAPLGFLFVEKLLSDWLGYNEYSLRLFPLIVGVLTVVVFGQLASRFVSAAATPIALSLFVLSPTLIRYSSEVKQYSIDVGLTVFLYFVAAKFIERKPYTRVDLFVFASWGMISTWFSHASTFILAGVGTTLLLYSFVERNWKELRDIGIVSFLWASSFAIHYMVSLKNLTHSEHMQDYWLDSFMPLPPLSFADLGWFIDTYFHFFYETLSLSVPGLGGLGLLFGMIGIFLTQRLKFFALCSPIFFTLLASGLHLYPFHGRLILFLTPIACLFIGEGFGDLVRRLSDYSESFYWPVYVLLGLLLFDPLLATVKKIRKPYGPEDIKPVLEHTLEHFKNGDMLYVHNGAQPAFKFYRDRYGFNERQYIEGTPWGKHVWEDYYDDLQQLSEHSRAWVMFSHPQKSLGVDEEKLFLQRLDILGKKRDVFRSDGAVVYLYEFTVD